MRMSIFILSSSSISEKCMFPSFENLDNEDSKNLYTSHMYSSNNSMAYVFFPLIYR